MALTVKGEFIDQAAHIVWAGIVLFPVAISPSLASFIWAGFAAGAIREITELGNPVTARKAWAAIVNSKLDLTFWAIGGAAVALIAGV